MSILDEANRLLMRGRYAKALGLLEGTPDVANRTPHDLLKAELLVNVGRADEARNLLRRLTATRHLSDGERSQAEFIESGLCVQTGDFDGQRQHLDRCALLADKANDGRRVCMAQLRLIGLTADKTGIDSVRALLATARANINKLGDPSISAWMHICVGENDAKRGLLERARGRLLMAVRLLEQHHNHDLMAWCYNNLLAIAILQADFESAAEFGEKAATSVNESGAFIAHACHLGNLGYLALLDGRFSEAIEILGKGMVVTGTSSEYARSMLETVARVHMARGDFEHCLETLAQCDVGNQPLIGQGRYVHRHAITTRGEALARVCRYVDALSCFERAIELARQADDGVLCIVGQLLRSETLLHVGEEGECWNSLINLAPILPGYPHHVYALYERVIACAFATNGDLTAATIHHNRAQRIYEALRNKPGQIELARSWAAAKPRADAVVPPRNERQRTAGFVLESVAALLMHAARPELLASGLLDILADTGCVPAAVAVMRDDTGHETVLGTVGATSAIGASPRTLALGTSRGQTIELRVAPPPDLAGQATLNSVEFLLSTVRDLERARTEREERLTLWPDDEIVSEDGSTIATGKMRDLLLSARRVASTTVNVLITGESGTGKEIVARAIHTSSARAKKAFVPFNCAAIPRDLLESQLFGFRRGAFTGADRDQPGMIRTARDGTLFLDEIGELGLDLQPKLLRFLESGEISPLGEPHPIKVDVRIVAATNANLLQLVEEGRFREDLYYRLNVVPLTIPPLRERRDEIPALVRHFTAKAAGEFDKGRVRVAEETMEHLLLYPWPGNVRQLQNELRRMVALAERDAVLEPDTLSKTIRQQTRHVARHTSALEMAIPLTDKLSSTIAKIEREMIKVALRAHDGRVEAAARALGISRKGLYLKRQRLGL